MAQGKLAKIMSLANNPTPVYTVSATASFATLTIDLDNTSPTDETGVDAQVSVYLADSTNFSPVDRVGFAIIPPGGHFTIGCGIASPGEHVIVVSDQGTVAIRLTGIEEIPA